MRRLLATTLLALALPAAAQVVPQENWTDMWYNSAESGWGLSFAQHRETNQVFAVWYTYDPREPDAAGQFKPLWIVMPGGTWTSPTRITGAVYVLTGSPVTQQWVPANLKLDPVGTFTIAFNDSASGTFTYDIRPPASAASGSPAFNLPVMSGTKLIGRQSF
ncbi:MAG TPA: hypothetical protein VFP36_13760 [Usitatibacter sp.]|nr:hypothetical protein [Usitatibacter sp.]